MASLPALPLNKFILVIILPALIFGCAADFNDVPWTLTPTNPDADGHVGPEKHQGLIHIGSDKDDTTTFGQASSSSSKTFSCKGAVFNNTFCNIKLSYAFNKHTGTGGSVADAGEKLKITVSPAGGASKDYYIKDQQTNHTTETIGVECGQNCVNDVTFEVRMTQGSTNHLQSHASFDISSTLCEATDKTNSAGNLTDASGNPLSEVN